MKKILCLIFCICLCFLSACSTQAPSGESEPASQNVLDSGKYYSVYRGEEAAQVCYDIYNASGKTVLSDKTDRPLEINMINDDIVDIAIGMGTGLSVHKYYKVSQDIFSQEYSYVVANQDDLVAYIDISKENPLENRRVTVRDIFDGNSFSKSFNLDFAAVDTPVLSAAFSSDGQSLNLTYLSSDNQKQTKISLPLT